jgi:hypothetical protein
MVQLRKGNDRGWSSLGEGNDDDEIWKSGARRKCAEQRCGRKGDADGDRWVLKGVVAVKWRGGARLGAH